jgi:hypothetical protein
LRPPAWRRAPGRNVSRLGAGEAPGERLYPGVRGCCRRSQDPGFWHTLPARCQPGAGMPLRAAAFLSARPRPAIRPQYLRFRQRRSTTSSDHRAGFQPQKDTGLPATRPWPAPLSELAPRCLGAEVAIRPNQMEHHRQNKHPGQYERAMFSSRCLGRPLRPGVKLLIHWGRLLSPPSGGAAPVQPQTDPQAHPRRRRLAHLG